MCDSDTETISDSESEIELASEPDIIELGSDSEPETCRGPPPLMCAYCNATIVTNLGHVCVLQPIPIPPVPELTIPVPAVPALPAESRSKIAKVSGGGKGHHTKVTYICPVCNFTAYTPNHFSTHIVNKHAGDKVEAVVDTVGVFVCDICSYHTTTKKSLTHHQFAHKARSTHGTPQKVHSDSDELSSSE